MIRLTKAYISAIGLIFILVVTVQLFRSSGAPAAASQSSSWKSWVWSKDDEQKSQVITSTPPKFERPPVHHGADGSSPNGYIDAHRWSDKVVSSVAIPYTSKPTDAPDMKKEDIADLKPVGKPATKPKEDKTKQKEKEKEKEVLVQDEAAESGDLKMMKEADCSAKKASTMLPLVDLNTTFHVDDKMHFSPKGPDPSEVVIVTASDGGGHNGGIGDILTQTASNRKSYCEHHGYNYHFVNISQYDLDNAHPVWKKIPAIVDAFNAYPKAQWVFFLDLDAIIMSPKQDLNSLLLSHAGMAKSLDFGKEWHWADWTGLGVFMPGEQDIKFDEIDMLIAQDQNGVNAGSFFLRRSKFTQWMLDMWADPFFMRHDWPGQEQDTLLHFIKHHKTFRQHVGLIKQRVANAYSEGDGNMKWQPGDLVVHFAGCWVGDNCQERWEEFWRKRGSLSSEYEAS